MNSLFNTPFEISVRVMLLLSEFKEPVSADRILITDFITTYGRDFEISDYNLNGDNSYRFSEFIARRELVEDAVKNLVLQHVIQPSQSKEGFKYALSEDGLKLIPQFVSVYAEKYLQIADESVKYIQDKSDVELLRQINQRAKEFKGEQ